MATETNHAVAATRSGRKGKRRGSGPSPKPTFAELRRSKPQKEEEEEEEDRSHNAEASPGRVTKATSCFFR